MALILVGHEASQSVTKAFRAAGHEAYSCDLKPCSGGCPEWHLQMDVFRAIQLKRWDMGLFFPDCTFLTASAEWAYGNPPYHQKVKPETLTGVARWEQRIKAIIHVLALWHCGINRISIENPVGVLNTYWRKPSQIIQPYQFGEDASKKTCLWLKNLPPLQSTKYVKPRIVDGKRRWSNQTDSGQNNLSPADNRAELRSKTYPGIAEAMSTQWNPDKLLMFFNYELT